MKIFFSILKRLNLIFRPKYSIVKRFSVKFLLNKYNWIDNRILSFRFYEKKNINAVLKLIKENDIKYFFDIGANIGYYSVMVAKKTNVKNISAFEPLRKNYHQLCANLFLNSINFVNAYNYAISNENKKLNIHYNDKSTGIATLNPTDTKRKNNSYVITEEIECRKFNELINLDSKKILIKIDVEGHEYNVLTSMTEFLQQNSVILIIEVNNNFDSIKDFLINLNYKQLNIDAEDYIFSNFVYSESSDK